MKILAIDPSVMNWAGWATVHLEWEKPESLPLSQRGKLTREDWDFGAFELSGMNFYQRCGDLKDYIYQHDLHDFDQLVIEWPMFYDNATGHIAARRGYTINLAGIAMFIAGWFQVSTKNLFLYTAPGWKGTVQKSVTQRRFFKLFGINPETVRHDTVDACMMLVFHCRKIGLTPNS